ncbi:hypothetical protein [Aerococcus sp. Group 1]|uniref:hypothetical protein n=1 Tax=Aerococcus urinae (strain CCUG 59500 / ACS-120-V-Col10a) TaxID=2976812 RepID=UPI00227D0CB0|nr:hypothetical protein [Aerococcus sp. Group 1]MCY3055211.1 hypothetical protein [Aerococcus sp. Group 1]MCY3056941.1 hypothetical protein [Aerococcus sp. Group 1]MCY3062437.1 hypothetical protein [Aerococcus sp. Group 1]
MGKSLSFPKQEQRYLRLAVDAYLNDRNNDAVDLFYQARQIANTLTDLQESALEVFCEKACYQEAIDLFDEIIIKQDCINAANNWIQYFEDLADSYSGLEEAYNNEKASKIPYEFLDLLTSADFSPLADDLPISPEEFAEKIMSTDLLNAKEQTLIYQNLQSLPFDEAKELIYILLQSKRIHLIFQTDLIHLLVENQEKGSYYLRDWQGEKRLVDFADLKLATDEPAFKAGVGYIDKLYQDDPFLMEIMHQEWLLFYCAVYPFFDTLNMEVKEVIKGLSEIMGHVNAANDMKYQKIRTIRNLIYDGIGGQNDPHNH